MQMLGQFWVQNNNLTPRFDANRADILMLLCGKKNIINCIYNFYMPIQEQCNHFLLNPVWYEI